MTFEEESVFDYISKWISDHPELIDDVQKQLTKIRKETLRKKSEIGRDIEIRLKSSSLVLNSFSLQNAEYNIIKDACEKFSTKREISIALGLKLSQNGKRRLKDPIQLDRLFRKYNIKWAELKKLKSKPKCP